MTVHPRFVAITLKDVKAANYFKITVRNGKFHLPEERWNASIDVKPVSGAPSVSETTIICPTSNTTYNGRINWALTRTGAEDPMLEIVNVQKGSVTVDYQTSGPRKTIGFTDGKAVLTDYIQPQELTT